MSDHSPEDRITHIDGVSRFCDTCDHEVWPCPTRILQDLIAELRSHCMEKCRCDIALMADRAEARLKGLTDE
jgi:hypothetical protein